MASTSSTPTEPSSSAEDMAAKALNKRYEGLVTVRTKATKGKGAWYWAHLEPILVRNPDTNLPKAVKLKCSFCEAVFSASNPSRTATEHLKRGTCPNFTSLQRPNSSTSRASPSSLQNHRKRSSPVASPSSQYQVKSLPLIESTRYCNELGHSPGQNQVTVAGLTYRHLGLSGGREDLGALALLEDSVKKLKSPEPSPGPELSKEQLGYALELLADWVYESCGSVPFSILDHPKFLAFLNQVGLPALSWMELYGARLDAKFHEAKTVADARIGEAMFFQVASDGWKRKSEGNPTSGEHKLVNFMVNLPNGTSVYQKAVITGGSISSNYAEEIIWETLAGICVSGMKRCVGIVADKYKANVLRNLEIQNHWMINLSCQLQGFVSLIKDFSKELSLFKVVTENCLKLAHFVNNKPQIRNIIRKHKVQGLEYAYAALIRVPLSKCERAKSTFPVLTMLEDILSCAQGLQMAVLDDSYKVACAEDPVAREVAGMIQSEEFWSQLEAVYSLVKLIKRMTKEIEVERPLIGQCLPLWEELRAKVKDWCSKFGIAEGPVEKIVEKRFRKNYHPAWSAAFILDPFYLMRDTSGKYLPPFKCLTNEQEKDVDKLITRLVSREEAHLAVMELMKWRTDGLDPLYAQAVQVKQRDPVTGKMKIANPQSRRLVWETCLSEYKSLGKIAVRLIFLHSTSCGSKYNWPSMEWICLHRLSQSGLERVQKMLFIAAQAKLERGDFSNEEQKEVELFSMAGGEDGMLNEVFADTPSV